jgi:hypothetical protein
MLSLTDSEGRSWFNNKFTACRGAVPHYSPFVVNYNLLCLVVNDFSEKNQQGGRDFREGLTDLPCTITLAFRVSTVFLTFDDSKRFKTVTFFFCVLNF